MLKIFLFNLLQVSLVAGVIILVVKLLSAKLNRAFDARLKYWLWLALAVRLLIPVGFALPSASVPVTLPPAMEAEATPGKEALNGRLFAATPQAGETEKTPEGDADAESTAQKARAPITPETAIAAVWLAGAALFLCKELLGYRVQRNRLLRWSAPVTEEAILARLRFMLGAMGVSPRLEVLVCKDAKSPMLLGFFRPKLLLPEGICGCPDGTKNLVLAHELVHFKRKDLWYKLLLTVANAVHWFNPLVHLMLREAARDLEISCDAEVVRGLAPDLRDRYGEAILAFLPQCAGGMKLSTQFTGGVKAMKARLDTLFFTGRKRCGGAVLGIALVALLLAGSLLTPTVAETEGALDRLIAGWEGLYDGDDIYMPDPIALAGGRYSPYALPETGDLSQEAALRTAAKLVLKFNGDNALDTYVPGFYFLVRENGVREWVVNFMPHDIQAQAEPYAVYVDALTGRVRFYQNGSRG